MATLSRISLAIGDGASNELLVIGLVRSCIWVVGVVVAFRQRLFLATAGFVLAAVSSTIGAFVLAGYHVGDLLVQVSVGLSTPTAVILIAAAVYAWQGVSFAELLRALERRRRGRRVG